MNHYVTFVYILHHYFNQTVQHRISPSAKEVLLGDCKLRHLPKDANKEQHTCEVLKKPSNSHLITNS